MSYIDTMIEILEEEPYKYSFSDSLILVFAIVSSVIFYNVIVPFMAI